MDVERELMKATYNRLFDFHEALPHEGNGILTSNIFVYVTTLIDYIHDILWRVDLGVSSFLMRVLEEGPHFLMNFLESRVDFDFFEQQCIS